MEIRQDIITNGKEILGSELTGEEVAEIESAMMGRFEMYCEEFPQADVEALFNEDFYDNLKETLEQMSENNEADTEPHYAHGEMVYTSPRGKQIIFDDYTDNTAEYQSYWSGMCPSCRNRYKSILGKRVHKGGMGTCSVKHCEKDADYYVDFSMDEVSFREVSMLSFDELKKLKSGDSVAIGIYCGVPGQIQYLKATVVQPLFWNSDADEPDWEIETTNGYADMYSVFRIKTA